MVKSPWFLTILVAFLIFGSYNLGTYYGEKCYAEGTNSCDDAESFTHLTPLEFKKAIETNEYTLLDIRTLEEYQQGHIQNASQVDFYQTEAFLETLDNLDKNKKYLIYCRSGNRTSQALQLMRDKGFKHVWDLDSGINAWTTKGFLIES